MIKYSLFLLIFSVVYLIYFFNIKKTRRLIEGSDENNLGYLPVIFVMSFVSLSVLIFTLFFYQFGVIPSGSMLPSFKHGQKILIDKNKFGFRNPITNLSVNKFKDPEHGEPIVIQFPLNPQVMYIKRVIGLPGDVISLNEHYLQINNDKYPLTPHKVEEFQLNGEKKPKKYRSYEVSLPNYTWKYIVDFDKPFPVIEETKIPEKGYFFVGDNLLHSADSREFGAVSSSQFIGGVI
jgi:signal peptidase I